MTDIYVTVLVDDEEHEVMPNVTGDNSKCYAKEKAKYWSNLGHTAKVGRVEIIDEVDPRTHLKWH